MSMATHRELFEFQEEGFSAVILAETEEIIHFRLNVKTEEEFQRWKELYMKNTNTCFNVKHVYPVKCRKLLHKILVCHHGSARHKGKKKTYTGYVPTKDLFCNVNRMHLLPIALLNSYQLFL